IGLPGHFVGHIKRLAPHQANCNGVFGKIYILIILSIERNRKTTCYTKENTKDEKCGIKSVHRSKALDCRYKVTKILVFAQTESVAGVVDRPSVPGVTATGILLYRLLQGPIYRPFRH